jgi:phosphopantetheinyl transferase
MYGRACFPGSPPALIETEAGGRPFFTGRHAGFSIAHSRNMVAVSYSLFRTGGDIEYVNTGKSREGTALFAFPR